MRVGRGNLTETLSFWSHSDEKKKRNYSRNQKCWPKQRWRKYFCGSRNPKIAFTLWSNLQDEHFWSSSKIAALLVTALILHTTVYIYISRNGRFVLNMTTYNNTVKWLWLCKQTIFKTFDLVVLQREMLKQSFMTLVCSHGGSPVLCSGRFNVSEFLISNAQRAVSPQYNTPTMLLPFFI